MEALQNPAALTPLALIGLVIVQVVQLFRGHMDAKAGREAKLDDSMAALLTRVLDQHATAAERQAATNATQATALERVATSMGEIQRHMQDTNQVLAAFQHRLEAVERQLGTTDQAPVPRPTPARARPAREA